MSEHTPTPWKWLSNHSLVADHGRRRAILTGRDLKQCNAKGLLVPFDPDSPDGRFIVRAVNCHDELVAACESMLLVSTEPGIIDVDEWKEQKRLTDHFVSTILAKAGAS